MFNQKPQGMRTYQIVLLGRFISLLGSSMSRFALMIWAYQQTHQATTLALMGFFSYILYVPLSPLAGALVDRWNRKWVLIAADVLATLMTLTLILLYTTRGLQIWHLYAAELLIGLEDAFRWPAWNASISVIVPKAEYARANGQLSLAKCATEVGGPFLAGLLLSLMQMGGVMVIDALTFGASIAALLMVQIPSSPESNPSDRRHLLSEMSFGIRYIFRERGLLGLMVIMMAINACAYLTYFSILAPMILARTHGDSLTLATVQGALGLSGVIGGLVVSTWSGFKRRIHGFLLVTAFSFLTGDLLFALGRSPLIWIVATLPSAGLIPLLVSSYRTIWQTKVAPGLQGRVFSIESMVASGFTPFAALLAGPLADHVFEPAMNGGSLSGIFGGLVGTGPGAGMALMFLCTCILGMTVCLSGYLFRSVRNVEDDQPGVEAVPWRDHPNAETQCETV